MDRDELRIAVAKAIREADPNVSLSLACADAVLAFLDEVEELEDDMRRVRLVAEDL